KPSRCSARLQGNQQPSHAAFESRRRAHYLFVLAPCHGGYICRDVGGSRERCRVLVTSAGTSYPGCGSPDLDDSPGNPLFKMLCPADIDTVALTSYDSL